MKPLVKLYITAFLQVFLVSANTLFIANLNYIAIIIAGFFISLFWTGNVKRISVGTWRDRIIYSFGATSGGIIGVITANLINQTLIL